MNLHLKLATLLTLCFSVLFIIIALSSNHWISTNQRNGYEFMGLWKACSRFECVTLTGGGYVKAFLVVSILYGIVCILMAAAVVYVQSDGPIGVLKTVAWCITAEAVLELIGMIHGSIIFGLDLNFEVFSWSFGLGWFAVILAIASAIICGLDHKLEPAAEQPILERIRSWRGGQVQHQIHPQGDSKPPPYSPPEGAVLPQLGPQGQIQTYQTPPMAYDNQSGYPPQQGYQPTSVAQ
ncbi:hypothetical protein NDU88_010818 [Pleurodeles waltl]|uniref:Uncharacterized protein n=1 Tax=Pleurodeles waltl TaxID=8319 RepID=A0AAV7PX59_PLEWA|nr:hypothetical protein NDU88_010818 [Pleurodeles waltl]